MLLGQRLKSDDELAAANKPLTVGPPDWNEYPHWGDPDRKVSEGTFKMMETETSKFGGNPHLCKGGSMGSRSL